MAGLSTAFQVPLDSLMLPQNVAFFQTMGAQQSQASEFSSPGAQSSGGRGGRPPAVGSSNQPGTGGRTRAQQLQQ